MTVDEEGRGVARVEATQGGTYGGNAIATLDVIQEESLVDNARDVGSVLERGLEKIAADNPGIGDVRGLGLMLGNEFVTHLGDPDPGAASRAQ